MPVVTRSQMSLSVRLGPGPPTDEADIVRPSVELIDLTGLSTDDENDDGPNNDPDNGGDPNGEWEDIQTVIDLTNLPSDSEDEAAVKIVSIDHAPRAPAEYGQRQQAGHFPADTCELCNREARYDRGITKHHLFPQSVVKAAPRDAYTTEQKNSVALLCWPCHSAIHRIMTNTRLATSFHSVPLLKANKEVQDWIRKMQRATTAELDLPRRRNRALHVASRASKRKTRIPRWPSYGRPLPSQRPDEDLSRFGGLRRSARLAELGTGSDFGAYSASQTHGVRKPDMTKKQRKLAKRVEKAAKVSQINQALNTIWAKNGNTFPKIISGEIGKRGRLRDEVQSLVGKRVEAHEVRYVLRSIPEYRDWYDWAFAFEIRPVGEESVGAPRVDSAEPSGVQDDDVAQAIQVSQTLVVREADGAFQALEGIQTPRVQQDNEVTQAIEGIVTHGAHDGEGGTPAMEGINVVREDTDDRGALGVRVWQRIKAMWEIGEYIPL